MATILLQIRMYLLQAEDLDESSLVRGTFESLFSQAKTR